MNGTKGQPPSGGCVLKRPRICERGFRSRQPPSGGCVLKPSASVGVKILRPPAAFGRLCVETSLV